MIEPGAKSYSDEEKERIIAHVLAELSTGRSIKRVLDEDEGMPAHGTFWRWHFRDVTLQDKVALARTAGVEALMDETVMLADFAGLTKDRIAKAKLQIETRQKYAAMIAPRKYGPRVDLTSGGEKLPAPAAGPVLQDNRIQALIALAANRRDQGVVIDVTPEVDDDEETRRLME